MFWDKVSNGKVSTAGSWGEFIVTLRKVLLKCQNGQIWRHNQAGDLPGLGNKIDIGQTTELVRVNKHTATRGFTYTHKPMLTGVDAEVNRDIVKWANEEGFTINLSANTLEQADKLADLKIGPVVVTVPRGFDGMSTPSGRKVAVCPAQTSEVTCARCGICQDSKRNFIVAFVAHGSGATKLERIISK